MIRSQRRHTFPQQQQEHPHSDHHYPSDDRRLLTMESLQLCPVVSEPPPPPPLAFPTGLPVYEGPFQIIEPGSEFYVQTDPNFCLEPLDTVPPQNLFLSENGIPPEVLADVFGLEDELEASYGMRLPAQQRPVPENVSLEQYETQLVAEMERLFPDVASPLPAPVVAIASPVAPPENIRKDLSEKPRYMNVQLADDVVPVPAKGGTRNVPVKHESLSPRDTELGFRCVNVTDDNGTTYKAKFYDHVTIQRRHSAPNKISYPTPSPKTYQTPSTIAKTPTTFTGTVSLQTPLRAGIGASVPPPRLTASSSSVSTIVIKAPKRTIAAGGIGDESPINPFFPMPIIKQEPRDDDYLPESFIVMESTPSGGVEPPPVMVSVPIVTATSIIKQPRKQKLLNLSQESEMVFKESSNVRAGVPGSASGPAGRALVAAPPPPKDYVTVTIPDTTDVKPQPLQHHLNYNPKPVPNPYSKALRSPAKAPGVTPKPRGILGTIERTHYRVLTTHSSKQEFGQPVESIEILDSSDEEKQPPPPPPKQQPPQREKLMTRKSKPQPASKPKLQGNTESIQCPYCCKIFLSPKVLISHVQNCADAHLFRESSRHRSVARANSSSVSLIKPNCGAQAAKSSDVNNNNSNNDKSAKPNPTAEKPTKLATSSRSSKKKRLCLTLGPTSKRQPSPAAVAPSGGSAGGHQPHQPHHKRSERLSIEILPSAFCIDNLLLCTVCQKSFRSAEQMEVHQKIHRAPVACEFCGKKFYESPPTKHVCQEMKRSMRPKRRI